MKTFSFGCLLRAALAEPSTETLAIDDTCSADDAHTDCSLSLRQLQVRRSSSALTARLSQKISTASSCHTVGPNSSDAMKECWDAVKWAKSDGVFANPDWYPGLSGSSKYSEFQLQMATKGQNGCPLPCEECETVGPDSTGPSAGCWDALKWAKSDGVFAHPDWYTGLSGKSTYAEFQAHMAKQGLNGCPAPCSDADTAMAKCKTVTEKCWTSVQWAAHTGVLQNPEWYPGLNRTSSYMDFIHHFAKNPANTDGCVVPQCQCRNIGPNTPGKCWTSIQWAAFTGIYEHPEWLGGLKADRDYSDFQANFARNGENECPWPCTSEILMNEGPDEEIASNLAWEADTVTCESKLQLGDIIDVKRKGLALDDTTLRDCPREIPRQWPHSTEEVSSLRLFKVSVGESMNDTLKAWEDLRALSSNGGVKFLIGIPVTCNETDDDVEFDLVMKFVDYVGKDRIMGLAIGNELDLLYLKAGKTKSPECLDRLWTKSGYLNTFFKRVETWDNVTGVVDLPVTAVFAMESMGGSPFLNLPGKAEVLPFLQGAWDKYGSRFVFTVNLYPYFSHDLGAAGCTNASVIGTKFSMDEPQGFTPKSAKVLREKMKEMGASDARLWVGETGWAGPRTGYCALGCWEACASLETFKKFYTNFLQWDLDDDAHGRVDHVFYFTVHDSEQFGSKESFGLIPRCGDRRCKLKQ